MQTSSQHSLSSLCIARRSIGTFRLGRAHVARALPAISRSSRSSYIDSTSVLKRSYIRLRFTLRVGVTGSPSSSGIERLGQDAERLDLLDARELAVGALDLGRRSAAPRRGLLREAGEAGVGDVVAARPVGDRVVVDLDQRGQVLAAVAEHHRLGDVGAGAQRCSR